MVLKMLLSLAVAHKKIELHIVMALRALPLLAGRTHPPLGTPPSPAHGPRSPTSASTGAFCPQPHRSAGLWPSSQKGPPYRACSHVSSPIPVPFSFCWMDSDISLSLDYLGLSTDPITAPGSAHHGQKVRNSARSESTARPGVTIGSQLPVPLGTAGSCCTLTHICRNVL